MTAVPSMNTRFWPVTRMPANSPPWPWFVPSPSKQQPLMITGARQSVPRGELLMIRTPSWLFRSVEQPTSLVASPKLPWWSISQPAPAHRSARQPT